MVSKNDEEFISKKLDEIKQKCTDLENYLKCKEDEICRSDGVCVKVSNKDSKSFKLIKDDGRIVFGNKQSLEKLQKEIGGLVESPKRKSSHKKRFSMKSSSSLKKFGKKSKSSKKKSKRSKSSKRSRSLDEKLCTSKLDFKVCKKGKICKDDGKCVKKTKHLLRQSKLVLDDDREIYGSKENLEILSGELGGKIVESTQKIPFKTLKSFQSEGEEIDIEDYPSSLEPKEELTDSYEKSGLISSDDIPPKKVETDEKILQHFDDVLRDLK